MSLSQFFRRQRRFQPEKSAVLKRSQWQRSGAKYLKGYRYKFNPADLVRPDPAAARHIQKLISAAFPAIAHAFNEHLGELALDAFDAWPTDTGLSKSLLGIQYETTDETLTGKIVCTAPYAYFIRDVPAKRTSAARPKNRALSPSELRIMSRPPSGVGKTEWQQAVIVTSRKINPVTYAYARGVLNRIRSGSTKRRRPRRGRRVVDELIFKKGIPTAEAIVDDIARLLGD